METTLTSKGQLTLPVEVRRALGIDAGTVLEVELRGGGSIMLRKKPAPGFFDQFVGLKSRGAPFATGDAARDALRRVEERHAAHGTAPSKPRKTPRKRR